MMRWKLSVGMLGLDRGKRGTEVCRTSTEVVRGGLAQSGVRLETYAGETNAAELNLSADRRPAGRLPVPQDREPVCSPQLFQRG